MDQVAVIRNPKSGRGRLNRQWSDIRALLDRHFDSDVRYFETEHSGDAAELSRSAVEDGASLVIAVGGDGTVSQVANGIIHSGATLGILPAGTGNDLTRTLGIGPSIKVALDAILTGNAIEMDAGKWATDRGSGYFLNVAGMGFDAAVAERINRGFRRIRGTAAYLVSVVSTLSSFRATEIRITVDGAVRDDPMMLVAIANAQCYGGGMKVAPMASVVDGIFDAITVRQIPKLEFLRAFPSVFRGAHLGHPAVDCLRGRSIRLEPRIPSPLLIDGELTPCRWAEIDVVPGALRVLAPSQSASLQTPSSTKPNLCDTVHP